MKKHLALFAFVASLAASAVFGAESTYKAEQWNLEARKKFADQRFGIFIHWGLYANYAQGEWYLYNGKLNEEAYSQMMYGFYPSKFNAEEWVKIVKEAGAKYITITSRHHDGFSLWPTKVDDGYNIANTPFKRDILSELAAAAKKEDIQLNFYYSLMDWHRKDYPPGSCASKINVPGRKGDYSSYKKFMLAQIGELIDSYHPGNIWFDGEWEHAHLRNGVLERTLDWELDSIYDFIHSKKTLTANNNHQPIRDREDIQAFERDLPGENKEGFSPHQPVTQDRPLEQCDVIQHGVWGYKIGEEHFRSADEIVAMVARSAAKSCNLLMNIGPDGSGQFPAKAAQILKDVGKWFAKNGESIYGTSGVAISKGKDIVATRKGSVLYLHFLKPGVDEISFAIDSEIISASYLASGRKIPVKVADKKATVTISRPANETGNIVVKLSF